MRGSLHELSPPHLQAAARALPDPRALSTPGVCESVLEKVLGCVVWEAAELGAHETLYEIYRKQLEIRGKKRDGLESSGKR